MLVHLRMDTISYLLELLFVLIDIIQGSKLEFMRLNQLKIRLVISFRSIFVLSVRFLLNLLVS